MLTYSKSNIRIPLLLNVQLSMLAIFLIQCQKANEGIKTQKPEEKLNSPNSMICIDTTNQLHPPFVFDSINITDDKYHHTLECKISSLDKYRCVDRDIEYITIKSPNFNNIILIKSNCGDALGYNLIILKDGKILSQKLVFQRWSEGDPATYTIDYNFSIDENYNFLITEIEKEIDEKNTWNTIKKITTKYKIPEDGRITEIK